MEVGDEGDLHVLYIALSCSTIVFLPFISKESGSQLEHSVTIALKCLVSLSTRMDSTSRHSPVEVLRQNVVLRLQRFCFHNWLICDHLLSRTSVEMKMRRLS